MKTEPLLVELHTEELPPGAVNRLGEALAQEIRTRLLAEGFISDDDAAQMFAAPRRLAVLLRKVRGRQADRQVERKGPRADAGFDAGGKPTPALEGFARSCGVPVERLERKAFDRGEHFVHVSLQRGVTLGERLGTLVTEAVRRLPAPKLMRWGAGEAEFVRPAHGLVMLHGNRIVPGEVLGHKSGRATQGHRVLSKGRIRIAHASDYERTLRREGAVIADPARRAQLVHDGLDRAAKAMGRGVRWNLDGAEALVDQVASLVEYPVILKAGFDPAFLEVPSECLVTSMQRHQKYFPLARNGKLIPEFLFVANTRGHPKTIIAGNERVLKARLSDARFFWDQDRKQSLEARAVRLKDVVYHNKLGSQWDRVARIHGIAGAVSELLRDTGLDASEGDVERAAWLCKSDLLTDMVGEFPELQGTMGRYYARHDGENEAVAIAIEEHYAPRQAGGALPQTPVGICVALADRLDQLTGMFGVGAKPTGDKDPFGLRRQALGVARILIERELPADVVALFQLAIVQFKGQNIELNVSERELYEFLLERLRPWLRERGFHPDEVESVLGIAPQRLDQILPRLKAIRVFRGRPEGLALAAANKRIRNILRQAGNPESEHVSEVLLEAGPERELAERVARLRDEVTALAARGAWEEALTRLATLRDPVDAFFDKVMVMAEDEAVRANRLALLNGLSNMFLTVADVSRLQG